MERVLDCSVIIPVYNRWEYTKTCLEGVLSSDVSVAEVIVVDNGSTDETSHRLSQMPRVKVLSNATNLGCAKAWNMGLAASSKTGWKIFLNNDVLLPKWFFSRLLESGEKWSFDIVCPAMRQGVVDYDLDELSARLRNALSNNPRVDFFNAVCFAVQNKVFEAVGTFDENFFFGTYEDTDFFRRVKLAGLTGGTVADSFLHHFGSMTQLALRKEGNLNYEQKNRRYYHKKWKTSWLKRKIEKAKFISRLNKMEKLERQLAGDVMLK